MEDLNLLEAQKERETGWVQAGAEQFMRRCQDETLLSPGAKAIMQRCAARLTAALEGHTAAVAATSRYPMEHRLTAVLAILGAKHVAAVTLADVVSLCVSWGPSMATRRRITEATILKWATRLSMALEHDIRFRVWRQDAKGAEKQALARMKRSMEGGKGSWSKRLVKLRDVATLPWSEEYLAEVGCDLLGILADTCPDVFEAPVVRYGGRTVRLFRLRADVEAALLQDTIRLSFNRPRLGLMLVPPRPWRYEGGEGGCV